MKISSHSKEIALYFDMLRSSRNISLEELTYEIVSLRQYRRYLRGEYQMPPSVFNKLSAKLGFKPEHVLLEFESAKIKETEILNTYHNAVINKDKLLIKSTLIKINPNYFLETNNKVIFDYSNLLNDFFENKITERTFIINLKGLINYDKLDDKSILSSTELIILSSLLPVPNFSDKFKIISILEGVIKKEKTIISGYNDRIILLCLYYLADYYGVIGKYNRVLHYCKEGILLCNKLKYTYLLEDFYYYSALAYFSLKETEKYSKMLYRCFCIINAEDNTHKKNRYYTLIEKDFNIKLNNFIVDYIRGLESE